jgi:predicted nucleic acid-binding protein
LAAVRSRSIRRRVYFIEDHPRFAGTVEPLFAAADAGRTVLVSSALTLLEVLVVPCRTGNQSLAERYEALLTRSRGLRLVDPTRDHLRAAAHLRAATGLRTPNAVQVARAVTAGCVAFVTNDRRLPPIPGLRVCNCRITEAPAVREATVRSSKRSPLAFT